LSTLVRTCGPLPPPAVRWLAAGCAEALESIHGAGLMHRDLKPSNVLVSPDGPRVIDFGVARAAERIQLTVTRGAVGTPAYMAPEQARDTRQATMASDVFSLGATMLFAATGHAPYQGETVMDVLVRLATEPPDLSGLPDELADVVRACLQRDPRKRPNSAAVLAHLAPGIGPAARDREAGPSSLPGPALALIEEYRRDPRPPDLAGEDSAEDATFGSQPGGQDAGQEHAGGKHARGEQAAGWRGGAARAGRPRRRWAVLAACLAAAVVVLAGAAAAGFAVADSRRPPLPPLPPPNIVVVPPAEASAHQDGRPQLAPYQHFGDGYTVFVVHGVGWVPGQLVTVALAGLRASPVHPVVDSAGTFSYAINQDHEFFAGPLPPGTYHVVVTVGGARAVTSFVVQRPPGPMPTTGPPGGSTTPGQ
jgi:hypothetical protein